MRYLVISEVELRDRPRALLGEDPPVDWLELEEHRSGAVTWKVVEKVSEFGAQ